MQGVVDQEAVESIDKSRLVIPASASTAKKTTEHTQTTQPSNTAQVPASQESVFRFCSIGSIGTRFQKSTCNRLNLAFTTGELSTTPCAERLVTKKLKSTIFTNTQQEVEVNIYQVKGDGNCLFRALSLAITGSQSYHELIRCYLVNHMMDEDVRNDMEPLFQRNHQDRSITYDTHLANMQQNGYWGTDQEIVAAANLFNVSIMCYSQYNKSLRLQHFPPHFSTDPECTIACKHHTLYLINSNGSHYNMAVVMDNITEE
jgi:hypothetical protein